MTETTVAEFTRHVFGRFRVIKNLENDLSTSWQETASDGLSRFQLWASNLGAYHDVQDPRSADSRLRRAPDVQRRIVQLLEDLLEDLDGIYEILSGQREGEVEAADDPDVPRDSDGEAEPRSEISELWLTVDNDITSLMKVSILIQRNSTRNKLQHAVKAAEKMSGSSVPTMWDRQRICQWFPKLEKQEWLLERLARTTTQRRQFLMYAEGHSRRIAHDSSGNFGSKSMFSRTTNTLTQAPTLASGRIDRAALEGLDHFEDDDDMSDTSATTRGSQLDGQGSVKDFNLVPLSSVCKEGKPGICPYCYDAVLFVGRRKRKLWRRHAFTDLMAYSCTFESCDRSPFGSFTAWATHEKTEHLRDWHCPICNDSCGSRSLLMAHVSDSHSSSADALSHGLINDASPPIKTAAATQCPFCDELETSERFPNSQNSRRTGSNQNLDRYQHHLGRHMEQLALLAKSASIGDDGANDDSDAEAFSQAVSSDTTEQSHHQKVFNLDSSERAGVETLSVNSVPDVVPNVAVQTPLQESVGDHVEDRGAANTAYHEYDFGLITDTDAQTFPQETTSGRASNNLEKTEFEVLDEFTRRLNTRKAEEAEASTRSDEAMRNRLVESGFTQPQVDDIMSKQKQKRNDNKQRKSTKETTTTTTSTPALALAQLRAHVPVYAKIHTDYISTETLRYYDVPWEYDRNDPSYIIILREMEQQETDSLFDHTKRLRSRRLLLAPEGSNPYRKQGRSKSREPDESREWKKFGILEYKR